MIVAYSPDPGRSSRGSCAPPGSVSRPCASTSAAAISKYTCASSRSWRALRALSRKARSRAYADKTTNTASTTAALKVTRELRERIQLREA